MTHHTLILAVCMTTLITTSCGQNRAKNPDEKESTYPILELGEPGVGRLFTFDAPLTVQHKLQVPGLADYKVTITVEVVSQIEKPPEAHLKFAIAAKFATTSPPDLPETSHVQLIIDGKATAEYPLKGYAIARGVDDETRYLTGEISLVDFRSLVGANKIEGRLYWQSHDGKEVRQNDPRTFVLDEKSMRTLQEMDRKLR